MNKTLLVACAVAGGLFVAFAAPPAQALPSVNLGIEKNADAVTPVGLRGGHHFRGGGYGFRHCRFNRLRLRTTTSVGTGSIAATSVGTGCVTAASTAASIGSGSVTATSVATGCVTAASTAIVRSSWVRPWRPATTVAAASGRAAGSRGRHTREPS